MVRCHKPGIRTGQVASSVEQRVSKGTETGCWDRYRAQDKHTPRQICGSGH
ncbi:unnamed protein product, partial [Staurois parvus]